MHFYSIFIVSIFVLFLSGCGGSSALPAQTKAPTPEWVNSLTPNDTSSKIYGMAIAKNRETAIAEALNDMISKLGISIESSFESYQKVENSHSNLRVESKIKADVSKVKINNYQVIKSHKLNYKEFAVMIEVDKEKFVSGLRENLEIDKKSITQRLASSSAQNTLNRYNSTKELTKEAKALVPVVMILAELDSNFSAKENLAFVSSVEKEFLLLSNRLKFYISGDAKSVFFVDKIKNNLAQQGFNIANNKTNAIHVELQTSDNINYSDIKIAVISIGINVYDALARIGGEKIIVKERYTTSQSVYKNAAIHFEQDIKSQGINALLGINLNID